MLHADNLFLNEFLLERCMERIKTVEDAEFLECAGDLSFFSNQVARLQLTQCRNQDHIAPKLVIEHHQDILDQCAFHWHRVRSSRPPISSPPPASWEHLRMESLANHQLHSALSSPIFDLQSGSSCTAASESNFISLELESVVENLLSSLECIFDFNNWFALHLKISLTRMGGRARVRGDYWWMLFLTRWEQVKPHTFF